MLKPLGDRVLVKKLEEENRTKSGIILKDTTTKQDILKAEVIEVSDSINDIQKSEKIYFSMYKGESIKYDDTEYVILEYKDILAKEI